MILILKIIKVKLLIFIYYKIRKKFLNNGEYKKIMMILKNMDVIKLKLWLWLNKVEYLIKNMNIILK